MLHFLYALVVYLLAIAVTFALMGLPVALFLQVREYFRTGSSRVPIWMTVVIGAAYLIGGIVGWAVRPTQWTMTFGQTFDAAFNAAKYGNSVEHQAERVLMYPWYMAVLFCILAAGAVGLFLRLRPQRA